MGCSAGSTLQRFNASTQTVVGGRYRSFLFWLKQHRQIHAPPFGNVKSFCAIVVPGWVDIRKNLRYRRCWQHNKTRSAATHVFTGILAFGEFRRLFVRTANFSESGLESMWLNAQSLRWKDMAHRPSGRIWRFFPFILSPSSPVSFLGRSNYRRCGKISGRDATAPTNSC